MKLPLSVTLNEAAVHTPPSSEIEVIAKVQEPIPATITWIVEGAVTNVHQGGAWTGTCTQR